jgi:hypothetical protein
MAKLTVYLWDTDIGQFLAIAKDVVAARKKVMAGITMKDAAREDLHAAIQGEPKQLGDKSLAILAWHS